MSIKTYYSLIGTEWFFGNKKKEEYKHEYECNFFISSDWESQPDPDYASKPDEMWELVIGEDKDDSVINNLSTYLFDYYFYDLENTFEEKKKRLWEEYNEKDKVSMKCLKKHLFHKSLFTDPYIIKTNEEGNFLRLDRDTLASDILKWSGEDSGKWPNSTQYEKNMTSEIFKLLSIYVNTYNEIADSIFKKLKKIK